MATNPNDIYLSEEQKRQIAEWADQNGKPWQTALQTMLEPSNAENAEEDWLDTEFMEWCAEQVRGKTVISLEEARRVLAKVSGSLSDNIIADRADRL